MVWNRDAALQPRTAGAIVSPGSMGAVFQASSATVGANIGVGYRGYLLETDQNLNWRLRWFDP